MSKKNSEEVQQIKVKTNLIGKEQLFKKIALADTLKLPLLVIGPPGTGKTNAVYDYVKAKHGYDYEELHKKVFMIEVDDSTQAEDFKGHVDLQALTEDLKFQKEWPYVADKDAIIVNEVDKTNRKARNCLLSIMNEKAIFRGEETIDLDWQLFVGICNKIPPYEKGSPFWDRFMLRQDEGNMSPDELRTYFTEGGKTGYQREITLNVPSEEAYQDIEVSKEMIDTVISVIAEPRESGGDEKLNKVSDRTLTFYLNIARACTFIYNMPIEVAMGLAAKILTGESVYMDRITDKLMPQKLTEIYNHVSHIENSKDEDDFKKSLGEAKNSIEEAISNETLSEERIEKGIKMISSAGASYLEKHPNEDHDEEMLELMDYFKINTQKVKEI